MSILDKKKQSKDWINVLAKYGKWSNATGYLHLESFAKYLNENFEKPQKIKK